MWKVPQSLVDKSLRLKTDDKGGAVQERKKKVLDSHRHISATAWRGEGGRGRVGGRGGRENGGGRGREGGRVRANTSLSTDDNV